MGTALPWAWPFWKTVKGEENINDEYRRIIKSGTRLVFVRLPKITG